jgi:hypothetical protein
LEDLPVLVQQVCAFHAGPARLGAHHQCPVSLVEDFYRVNADGHLHDEQPQAQSQAY